MTRQRPSASVLREEFDRSFALRADSTRPSEEALIAIQVSGRGHALRLADLASLHVDRVIVRVPTPVSSLIGLIALRGAPLPVYDLSALLGYAQVTTARWIAITRTPRSVALGFDAYEQHIRVGPGAIIQAASPTTGHINDVLQIGSVVRPIVPVASLIASIEQQATSLRKG